MTFTDAEARIYEELGSIIRGEFSVTGISRTEIHDIFHNEDSDEWYKIKISFKSEGEEGKWKNISQTFLISAHSVKDACERLKDNLQGLIVYYKITSAVVSPIVEIFTYIES